MKKKGIRSSAVAGLLTCALTMSLIPMQFASAQPTGTEGSTIQDIANVMQTLASYTVSLDLEGGAIPDLSDEGWTQSGDGVWTIGLTEQNPGEGAELSVPEPKRDGYLFTGWLTSDNGETLPALTDYQITGNTKFTATWQQQPETSTDSEDPDTPETSTETEQETPKESDVVPTPNALSTSVGDQSSEQEPNAEYSITFDNAEYQPKVGTSSDKNTINFSHVNANYPEKDMTADDIVNFLNQYVPSVKLDYTITYTSTDDGTEPKTVTQTRSGVDVSIDWTRDHADFSGVESNMTAMDGTDSKVFLDKDYLKDLIVDHEKTVTQEQAALPNAGTLTKEDLTFSDGYADKLALTITIGTNRNKYTEISQDKEQYTIDTVSPNNVTLNLFDYWLSSDAYYDENDTSMNVLAPLGINQNHGLLFFKNGANGLWNAWTQARQPPRTGIVKNELGTDGYPVLNLKEAFSATGSFGSYGQYDQEESLKYLFDPKALNASGDGKGYSGVKNLFKINEDGNYYFSSHDNFAEFDPKSNSFNVYNTWGVQASGSSPKGQFFPFNTADQVFSLTDGKLVQASGVNSTNSLINHYLGLSMEAKFQQPIDGMVSVGSADTAKPMEFQFSGDDDVWIFIDGVLVADLGGIHDEASVEIDFSTGEVVTYLASDKTKQTNRVEKTLKAIFDEVGKDTSGFNGDTFGNNTTHTLKMFYLERGNYDSNLTLSFNLMEPAENTLVKLDQDGEPMADVKFDLYVAEKNSDGSYDTVGSAIASVETDENGMAKLPWDYDFSQNTYYILKEQVPPGYFCPEQVVLRYDRLETHQDGTKTGTNLLMVENRWTTGATSNFSASVYQAGALQYDTGDLIDPETGAKGLILAVPLLKGTDDAWHPLYGSNMVGFHDVKNWTDGDETQNTRRAILEAALYQIYGAQYQRNENEKYDYGFPEWYLERNKENDRYEGNLIDLPGDASRYYWASGDQNSDLTMAYYFLDLEALKNVFDITDDLSEMTSEEKLQKIANAIDAGLEDEISSATVQASVENMVRQIDTTTSDGKYTNFALLDISKFNRVFSSRIYVPNVSPELTVVKLDEQGEPLKDAEFTLYESDDDTETGQKTKVASGTTDANGVLVFSASGTGEAGSAKVTLKQGYYWVKETGVPSGYIGNNTEYIPVYVTENGRVYADALDKDDGITVRKGLGRLLETMVRFAAEDSVNVTLRDITATLVTGKTWQEVGQAVQGAASTAETATTGQSLHLHYGLDNALLEYGTHEVNGVTPNPYFEVDEDIAGIQVQQDYDAHKGDILYSTVAGKIDLQGIGIRNLFTGSTAIVVRNRDKNSQGAFSVAKTVTGSDVPEDARFRFDVSISGELDEDEKNSWTEDRSNTAEYTVTQEAEESQDTAAAPITLQTGKLTFTKDASSGNWKIAAVDPDGSGQAETYFRHEGDSYQLQLQNGQKILVNGVPFGLLVTVQETQESSNGYTTMYTINNGNLNTGTTASGTVKVQVGDPSFRFYNNKDKVANLTLEKLLPKQTDSTNTFPFTIQLNTPDGGTPLTGTYSYQVKNIFSPSRETEGTVQNGQLTVELGHGDKLTIQGLPVGTQYLIRETTNGYTPTVTIDGNDTTPVDGQVAGTVKDPEDPNATPNPDLNTVVYSNTRSGSITITKRNGTGQLLSGAGFTLYTTDGNGNLTEFTPERLTELAMRDEIDEGQFNRDTMRYNKGTESYVVHTTDDGKSYFYYRLLTDAEREQYYAGTLPGKENVEAIVQFTELPLDNTYAIKETTVPDGYMQNADIEDEMSEIKLPFGELPNEIYDVLYTVVNHKQMTLPTSGLDGIGKMLATGLLLTTLAAVLLWIASRRIPGAGPDPKRRSRH